MSNNSKREIYSVQLAPPIAIQDRPYRLRVFAGVAGETRSEYFEVLVSENERILLDVQNGRLRMFALSALRV